VVSIRAGISQGSGFVFDNEGHVVTNQHVVDGQSTVEVAVLPGLPWRASFGRTTGPAPGLGADCDHVLTSVLGLSQDRIADLRTSGALG
jgi:putative serine protease PepD